MQGTTESSGSGKVYPVPVKEETNDSESVETVDYSSEIDNVFVDGDIRPMRKTAIRRAEVSIARKFAKGRTGLVSSIVDTLLYETTLAFKDESRRIELADSETVLLFLDCELLAEEEGFTARSIQQVFQDLEECGYIHRGRGGAHNGLTGVVLSLKALRDPDTRWVLQMKGRRVDGLQEWLERCEDTSKSTGIRNKAATKCEAEQHSHEGERTKGISSDTYIYTLNPPDVEKSNTEIETSQDFSTSAPQASEQEDRWVLEIGRCIREANFRGPLQPETLRELVTSSDRSELDRPTLLKYVDCKLWELAEVRQAEYPAQTVATILRSDLKHAGAVIANLERRYQQWLQRQAWEECQETQTVEPKTNKAEVKNSEPEDPVIPEPSNVSAPVELSPWQIDLKERVSSSTWTNFLSKLELVEEELERVVLEVVDGDKFTAAWIRDQLWRKVSGVFGEREVELRDVA